MLSISHFSGLRFPRSPSFFSLHILMTNFCYSFRLVQFQFSTTDCYLNDSIPFSFFLFSGLYQGPTQSSGHERIFYCILNIFSIVFEQLLCFSVIPRLFVRFPLGRSADPVQVGNSSISHSTVFNSGCALRLTPSVFLMNLNDST